MANQNSTPIFPAVPTQQFTVGFHDFKIFAVNRAVIVRDLTAQSSEIFYSAASLDWYLSEVARIGKQIEAERAARIAVASTAEVPQPIAETAIVETITEPVPSLIDFTICESCGENIPDGELCKTCKAQSDADLQPVVTTRKPFAAPKPGIPAAVRTQHSRNARTGNEQHTSSQQANRELMARYPHAKTLDEAFQLSMHDYLASKRISASALKTAGAR